ncbi:MAG TPA: HAMP domain-containing sensor histidine kinase [Candidatus Aquilonibacter sp.]|nr:HAMP domain-containing sensor histidine kinase [Candidatus Aquilonibacter sp.]
MLVARTSLRTRFLLSMLIITAGLTATSLLVVRRSVQNHVRQGIVEDLRNSVVIFQNFQRERETMLTRSAELVAYLPITRAIMTAPDSATIQDASSDLWRIADSDLFVLANRDGKVVALHTKNAGLTAEAAQRYFEQSLKEEDSSHWWFGGHHLYQAFVQPIYFGSRTEGPLLGFLIVGYEIDDQLAREISRVSASQVAFSYGSEVVATTLSSSQSQSDTVRKLAAELAADQPQDVEVGEEHFLATSLDLSGRHETLVRLSVLESYDQATRFLNNLNRLLILLGIAAVVVGSILVYLISHTFTRPLASLVDGVRALEHGDFQHPLDPRGSDEIAELTVAFDRMRASLLKTQNDLLESEQLATIGRMASSISHDLRHSLAAIVANSEFLCDGRLTAAQREELYQEVRTGVNQMTDLIDSLLEFARTRESLTPAFSSVSETVQRAVQAVRLHPRHQGTLIEVQGGAQTLAWFDPRKLERALYNLLLNACEAAPAADGRVEVAVRSGGDSLTIAVSDNGPGIAEPIREKLFHPFVSYGKQNGTGLGLTVVQKIVQDHGGEIFVERTAEGRTVFRIVLPGQSGRPSQPEEAKVPASSLASTETERTSENSGAAPG